MNFSKPWVRTLVVVVVCIVGVYGLIYWDVRSRAREAYAQGEMYMNWHANPQKKKDHYEAWFLKEKDRVDADYAKKKFSEEDYKRKIEALEFTKQFNIEESSLKYAYQWYKDTYELFSPPESKWVRLSREKAPTVLELWKQELKAQNIPFTDLMLQ